MILGLLLAFLCVLLWCYKPLARMLQKRRVNNATDRFLNEMASTPSDFPDAEMWPGEDLPTYQAATADVPPSYDNLYGDGDAADTTNAGLDNPAADTVEQSDATIDARHDESDSPNVEGVIVSDNARCPVYSDVITNNTDTVIETSPDDLPTCTRLSDNEPNSADSDHVMDDRLPSDARQEGLELLSFGANVETIETVSTNVDVMQERASSESNTLPDVIPSRSEAVNSRDAARGSNTSSPIPDEEGGIQLLTKDDSSNSTFSGHAMSANDSNSYPAVSLSRNREHDECFV